MMDKGKKRWINAIQPICDYKNSQGDISWSSDSEFDNTCIWKLKRDIRWIEPAVISPVFGSTPKLNSPDESPIISSCSVEELSPVLAEKTTSDFTNETSPIIGRRRLLKEKRTKFKKTYRKKQENSPQLQTSPDIFETQKTTIIEHDSPDYLHSNNISLKPVDISDFTPVKSKEIPDISQNKLIQPFPSQYKSQITKIDSTESTCTNSSDSLYHQPAPKRKHYKKKGLASQLQKALSQQKTRVSIWRHELYLKRSELELATQFMVLKIKKEYGNIILECDEIESIENEKGKSVSLSNIQFNNFIFILISGTNITEFKEHSKYKMYKPFESKTILYNSKETTCYYNVTKITK